MQRVMLTLPQDLLTEVDAAARHLGKKRSQVVRLALHDWLQRMRREEFEAHLAEGYQALAEQSTVAVADSLPAQEAAAAGLWQWDD